jgi:hypothetical protein
MPVRSFLTSQRAGTRIALIAIGSLLLLLAVNQLFFQRWGFAAVQGSIGLGLLLTGALSSNATLMRPAVRNFFRIALWNVAFVVGIAVVAVSVDRLASDFIGLSLPYIAAVWLLVLGARFAHARIAVISIATVASLLLVLQAAIFSVAIVLSPDNEDRRTQYVLLLAVVIVTGLAFVSWFVGAKRSRAKTPAQERTRQPTRGPWPS